MTWGTRIYPEENKEFKETYQILTKVRIKNLNQVVNYFYNKNNLHLKLYLKIQTAISTCKDADHYE